MLPKNTMKTVAMELAIQLADEMFRKKCTELNEAIDLVNSSFDQRCDDLDEKLAGIFIEAFEGERISETRMKRIAGKFVDILVKEKVAVDAVL